MILTWQLSHKQTIQFHEMIVICYVVFLHFSASDADIIVIPRSYIWRTAQTTGVPGLTIIANGTNVGTKHFDELAKQADQTENCRHDAA